MICYLKEGGNVLEELTIYSDGKGSMEDEGWQAKDEGSGLTYRRGDYAIGIEKVEACDCATQYQIGGSVAIFLSVLEESGQKREF